MLPRNAFSYPIVTGFICVSVVRLQCFIHLGVWKMSLQLQCVLLIPIPETVS